MPKLPGVNHLRAIKAQEKAGFKIDRQGKHVFMSKGSLRVVIPRNNPVDAYTMAAIVRDAGLTEGMKLLGRRHRRQSRGR
jgi:predicted RNA binding protein YcfA (HicA-like mRNA interferase family)